MRYHSFQAHIARVARNGGAFLDWEASSIVSPLIAQAFEMESRVEEIKAVLEGTVRITETVWLSGFTPAEERVLSNLLSWWGDIDGRRGSFCVCNLNDDIYCVLVDVLTLR